VAASQFHNHGQRVVEGQWLMQAASDSFLGWCPAIGIDGKRRDFYVRQLWDGKGSTEVEAMGPAELGIYARLCGWTLARAHARSGDSIAIGSYLGGGDGFDRAIAEFSVRYADQNEADHAALVAAISSGHVAAEEA
jgi:predicted alpha/beta hydrolase